MGMRGGVFENPGVRHWVILLVFLAFPAKAGRGALSDNEIALKNERVIVFKDGYCMVVKTATATTDQDGQAFTFDVPDSAVLGSFWAVNDQGTIKGMVAGWKDVDQETTETADCTTTADILEANLGRECSFEFADGRPMSGVVSKILGSDSDNTDRKPKQFLLKTRLGDVAIKLAAVNNLTIESMVSTTTRVVKKTIRRKRLTLKFKERNQAVKFRLMYFRPDVRWIPTYRVDLTDKTFEGSEGEELKTAGITLQGEILNEAEDFFDVPFHVVVGVPNFRFRDIPSPMTLEPTLRSTLVQALSGTTTSIPLMSNSNASLSNAVFSQQVGQDNNRLIQGANRSTLANAWQNNELVGKSTQDLFVYELPAMTLKKGERANVPIMNASVGYRDIYTWDAHVKRAATYAPTATTDSPLVLAKNKTWHQVELLNHSDIPWTTGAAMLVDGFQPLAQELLTYTSPGSTCRVPVTIAVDVQGKMTDQETGRKLNAMKWRSYQYAQADGKVDLSLVNNTNRAVSVEIQLRLGGRANTASKDGVVTLSPYRSGDWYQQADTINNSSLVKWKTQIPPGKSFDPQVLYDFWIRY